jgi:hypothetical protein
VRKNDDDDDDDDAVATTSVKDDSIQFLFICVETQEHKCQLQSKHESR